MELAAVADEIYGLPLDAFIAERTDRVKAARTDGDRELASRIGGLAKPSTSAWLVNRLVRDAADDLQRVLDLGDALRGAQEASDRVRLRELTAERRILLADVAAAAADRAEGDGHRVSAAVLEEFQETLQAALISEEAAAAVRSGRLIHALRADGLDPVDVTDAVALPAQVGAAGRARPATRKARSAPTAAKPPEPEPEPDTERAARDRRREEAEARVAEARRVEAEAHQHAEEADAVVEERSEAAESLHARIRELSAQLAELRATAADAEDGLADAQQVAARARREADAARRTADEAERAAADAASDLDGLGR